MTLITREMALSAIKIVMPFTKAYELTQHGPEEYSLDCDLYEYRFKRMNGVPAVRVRYKPTGKLSLAYFVRFAESYDKELCAVMTRKATQRELERLRDYII